MPTKHARLTVNIIGIAGTEQHCELPCEPAVGTHDVNRPR